MNCAEVQDLLSEYHDDELVGDLRARVADHLRECPECANELARFDRLSQMASALRASPSVKSDWQSVEERLTPKREGETESPGMFRPAKKNRKARWLIPLAASLVLAVAILGIGRLARLIHGEHDHSMATFATYIDEFQRDPNGAQAFLLTQYKSTRVTPQQATKLVGYQPALANGLPADLALEATYVIKMPCCDCVQCLCNRPDGSVFAVFEHDDENAGWFKEYRSINVKCGGVECCIVEMGEEIAATWKHQNRFITLVGARDVADVNQLIAWIDDRKKTIPN